MSHINPSNGKTHTPNIYTTNLYNKHSGMTITNQTGHFYNLLIRIYMYSCHKVICIYLKHGKTFISHYVSKIYLQCIRKYPILPNPTYLGMLQALVLAARFV